ncbi:hypothetical protein P280DRAFT_463220 [Massarina eburnea CBS 473.64]|uniref:Uncharacterized protein n=1 Tax=Massarina eburnea CBS 473.64 TaxID=1395130 RepID=A0A6A6RHR3_9PLEO|nr:hypothetical protein P280DRAFT_463220 [Massarina eburnea CBS 473.64]
MPVSPVDIITYVGIPLAVLGVLPTIYTCLKSFFTLRDITKSLQRNGVIAITRSALLTGIVEIEIPRRSIIPLDRNDPKYFSLRERPSALKGGTWTLFNWKEMVIGVKSYRLQYSDELMQPQTEIEFEALVAFLLDRGAVPSATGWVHLRNAGLWTPAGTKLLVVGDEEEVLSVALSDDSDGILSLSLGWREEWGSLGRGRDSLPPYWIRVAKPRTKEEDLFRAIEELEKPSDDNDEEKNKVNTNAQGGFLDDDSAVSVKAPTRSPTIRIRISTTGVQASFTETETAPSLPLPLLHLRILHTAPDATVGFWFSCMTTAFQAPQGGLWSFNIPPETLSIAQRETVPCGVMVILGTMTDDQVPAWRTSNHDDKGEQFERHVRFQEQSRRMNEEMRLPPEQRDAARRRRQEQEAAEFHDNFRRKLLRDEQRREAEILEAIQSQRLPTNIVATANLAYLSRKLNFASPLTIPTVIEQMLYTMLHDPSFSMRLATMLDLWKNWALSGGMTKSHFLAVKEDQITFALASVVWAALGAIRGDGGGGNVMEDLQECLRVWKKVRLG